MQYAQSFLHTSPGTARVSRREVYLATMSKPHRSTESRNGKHHSTNIAFAGKKEMQSLLCTVGYFIFEKLGHRRTPMLSGQDVLSNVSYDTNR